MFLSFYASFFCFAKKALDYFAWDVLACSAVLCPELFEFSTMHIKVHTDQESASYGRTEPVSIDTENTKPVQVALKCMSPDEFYALVLKALRVSKPNNEEDKSTNKRPKVN